MADKIEKMIVKVQVSLFTSDDIPTVLVYNEDRSHRYEGPIIKGLMKKMNGYPKKFFWANVNLSRPDLIDILEEAPWQKW